MVIDLARSLESCPLRSSTSRLFADKGRSHHVRNSRESWTPLFIKSAPEDCASGARTTTEGCREKERERGEAKLIGARREERNGREEKRRRAASPTTCWKSRPDAACKSYPRELPRRSRKSEGTCNLRGSPTTDRPSRPAGLSSSRARSNFAAADRHCVREIKTFQFSTGVLRPGPHRRSRGLYEAIPVPLLNARSFARV